MEDAPLLGVRAGDFVVDIVGGGLKEGGAAGVGFGGGFVAAGVGAFEEVAHDVGMLERGVRGVFEGWEE